VPGEAWPHRRSSVLGHPLMAAQSFSIAMRVLRGVRQQTSRSGEMNSPLLEAHQGLQARRNPTPVGGQAQHQNLKIRHTSDPTQWTMPWRASALVQLRRYA
jgi:hypothetical protein